MSSTEGCVQIDADPAVVRSRRVQVVGGVVSRVPLGTQNHVNQ